MEDEVAEGAAEVDRACFETALSIKVDREPVDRDAVRAYAHELAKIAKSFAGNGLAIDLPLIARAVHYLNQVHAIPMGGDTRWFTTMLAAVLEVARPNVIGLENEALAFVNDMEAGIKRLREGS